MGRVLLVREPFGGYARDALIDDQARIAAVLSGPNAGHCVAAELPDAVPDPAPEPDREREPEREENHDVES
jgi:hypothetical protein